MIMKAYIYNKVSAMAKGLLPFCLLAAIPMLDSCKSGDQEFPDYDYQTCYFSKQYPVRTVEIGNDNYVNLTLDNQHKIQIQAAMGGAYNNPRDINIDIAVDGSLCTGKTFKRVDVVSGETETGIVLTEMPSSYYTMASSNITIPSGEVTGGVEVQLEDAFFNDPLSTTLHYAIPVKMTKATGVDHILEGKDFVLYAVRYVNRYHGKYVRNEDLLDQVLVTTKNLNTALYSYEVKDGAGTKHVCELELNFAADGTCTITPSAASVAAGFAVTGTGRFAEAAEQLGARMADTMYLNFRITNTTLGINYTGDEKLRLETRNVITEYLSVQ